MKSGFGPAVALMARLKFPQRFGLITVLFLMPLGIALFMLVSKMDHDINFAQREIQGTNYLRPASMLFRHTLNDWLLSQQAMRGLDTNNKALEQNQIMIDTDLDDLTAADSQYGTLFGTTEKLNKIKADWAAMRVLPQTIDRQILYKPFIASIRDLIAQVGDQSNLVLDSSLDTHYTMRTLVTDLPTVQNTLASLAVLGDQVIGSRNVQEADKAELNVLGSQVLDSYINIRRNADIAYANNPAGNLKESIEEPLAASLSSADDLLAMLTDQILTAPQLMLSLDTWKDTATKALTTSAQQWDEQVGQLDALLQNRIATDSRGRNFALLITATVLLLVAYMWVGFYLAVMRAVTGLEEAGKMLATGRIGAIDLGSKDELSQRTAQAINKMASTTKTLNSAINARTNELTEVALLLAHMHDGVIITDSSGVVRVLNGAACRMMGVKYEDAVNHSLVDLTRQPRLGDTLTTALSSPAQHYMVDIALGNRIISSTVTFAPLADGNVTGLIIFQDVTELRTLQALQQQQTNRLAAPATAPATR